MFSENYNGYLLIVYLNKSTKSFIVISSLSFKILVKLGIYFKQYPFTIQANCIIAKNINTHNPLRIQDENYY